VVQTTFLKDLRPFDFNNRRHRKNGGHGAWIPPGTGCRISLYFLTIVPPIRGWPLCCGAAQKSFPPYRNKSDRRWPSLLQSLVMKLTLVYLILSAGRRPRRPAWQQKLQNELASTWAHGWFCSLVAMCTGNQRGSEGCIFLGNLAARCRVCSRQNLRFGLSRLRFITSLHLGHTCGIHHRRLFICC